jgi:hypothetical protein
MSFLYPSFLFGLAAVAIPIAIHLFNFRKTRKVFFSNVAFLKTVKTSTRSFQRLKHLLIMTARVFFIAFLVLAFAQPFIPSKSRHQAISNQGITSIYLDNSLSMQNELGKSPSLYRAAEQVDRLLGLLPNTPSYQLLTNDFESREQLVMGNDKLKDRLTEVRFSNTSRPLDAVYNRQLNLLNRYSQSPNNQVFWFSDFQKSTLGDISRIKLDTLNQYYLVPVQGDEASNVFVDSLWMETPFVKEMESNVLNVRLVNTGKETKENIPVKLFIDERQVSAATITMEPESAQTAVFNFTVQEKGFKKARVSFEDYPVTFDNDFYFVINVSPVINILHVHQGPASPYVTGVFSNESVFNNRSQSITNADLALMNTSDLVVLEGLTSVDASLQTRLQNFVNEGGSLLIFPGAQADAAAYGQLLGSLGVRNVQAAPATPGAETENSASNALAPPDLQNPFFNAIFESTTQRGIMNMPNARPVLQWRNAGTPLLRFRSGQPFLSRFTSGKGNVYLSASPLNLNFSNFPKHALFVPVLYKIASMSKTQEQLAYSFGESAISVEVAGAGQDQVYKLKKDKFEIIPAQRQVGNQLTFDLPANSQTAGNEIPESGYYELVLNGKTERILAFNYDKEESRTENYRPEELKKIFADSRNVQVFDAVQESSFINDFQSQNIGRNLWKYCLYAALFFLALEVALIRLL